MRAIEGHPGEDELRAIAAGRRSHGVAAHLSRCAACQAAVETYAALGAMRPGDPGPCPAPESLVRLAAIAAADERGRSPLQAHVAGCLDCSLELEGLYRLAADGPPPIATTGGWGARLADRLRSLVAFEMPPAVALNPRGAVQSPATGDVRAGMKAYAERRFAAASDSLLRARDEGQRSPAIDLYLGAALLRAGRAAAAAGVLAEAAGTGRVSREHRWFLAQALLAEGRGVEALSELQWLSRRPGPYRAEAKGLAGKVRALVETDEPAEG